MEEFASRELASWVGSPIPNQRRAIQLKRRLCCLMNVIDDQPFSVLTPGNHTGQVRVEIFLKRSDIKERETADRPVDFRLSELVRLLRRLYPRRGQGTKKFGGLTLREWVAEIEKTNVEAESLRMEIQFLQMNREEVENLLEIAKMKEEQAKSLIEDLWQAYGMEHGFDRESQLAFKKALRNHGLRLRKATSRGWGRWHTERFGPRPCSQCNNSSPASI